MHARIPDGGVGVSLLREYAEPAAEPSLDLIEAMPAGGAPFGGRRRRWVDACGERSSAAGVRFGALAV